jgi:hypothetical protein
VSTILKSLKKLEQENRSRRNKSPYSGYQSPEPFASRDAKGGWFKNVWFKRGLVTTAILVLGVTTVYYYRQTKSVKEYQASVGNQVSPRPELSPQKQDSQKPAQTLPPAVNESNSGIENITPRTTPQPVKKATEPKRVTPTAESAVIETRSANPTIQEENLTSRQPISQRPPRPTVPPKANEPAPTAQPSVNRPPATDRRPPPVTEKQPPKPSSPSFNNVPILRGGGLKVHAIVWSPVSKDRMTVINSRILYEGDTVDGYTLLSIRADDVVVRKDGGGGKYRVLFGRP